MDIIESTYLQPPPESILSSTDLITRQAITLQKQPTMLAELHSTVLTARRKAAIRFEEKYKATLHDFNFKKGNLVLVRNTKIEKSLNRKMRPRYLGPVIVIARNKGGAYILCELDGSVFHRPLAAFRLIPYLARRTIEITEDILDIDLSRLKEMKDSEEKDDEDYQHEDDKIND
ncbi:hypothetical protein DXG01_005771 [Tephrocybe rancida]|nr:hypothetical protein DXG01_005771 [Tephrocybe rancida]